MIKRFMKKLLPLSLKEIEIFIKGNEKYETL